MASTPNNVPQDPSGLERFQRAKVTDIKVPADVELNFEFTTRTPRLNGPPNDSTPPSSLQSSPRKYLLCSPRERGIRLHEKRKEELPKYEFEEIPTTTAEDRFNKNLICLYWTLNDFSEGRETIAREVPIYGQIGNVILSGCIDEMRYNGRKDRITISELKSGDEESPMRVKNDNRVQVALYTYLCTKLRKIDIPLICAKGTTVPIDGDKPIKEELRSYCPDGVKTPKELLQSIKLHPKLRYTFPEVEYVQAYYTHEGELSEELIEKEIVHYDESLLLRIVEQYLKASTPSPDISPSVVRNLSLEL